MLTGSGAYIIILFRYVIIILLLFWIFFTSVCVKFSLSWNLFYYSLNGFALIFLQHNQFIMGSIKQGQKDLATGNITLSMLFWGKEKVISVGSVTISVTCPPIDNIMTLRTKAHSFPRATKFQAEQQNFYISTEFHRILQKLKIQQWLVWFLTWWRIFIMEKIKLNCQKLSALLIAIATWHSRKYTQHNLKNALIKRKNRQFSL